MTLPYYWTGTKMRFFRNVTAFFLAALCCYGLYQSWVRGTASAWYYQADFALQQWNEKGAEVSDQDYVDALTAVVKAQQLDPGHPHYAHMVGRITHWGISMGYELDMTLEDVKNWYLLATSLRPLWPEPWVDLVMLSNSIYGLNDETKHYIGQAQIAGPYMNAVTVAVVKVYLFYWEVLTEDEVNSMFEQLGKSAQESKVLLELLKFAKDLDKESVLCDEMLTDDAYAKYRQHNYFMKYCANK